MSNTMTDTTAGEGVKTDAEWPNNALSQTIFDHFTEFEGLSPDEAGDSAGALLHALKMAGITHPLAAQPSAGAQGETTKLLLKVIDTLKPFADVAEKLRHCHVVEICEPHADNPSPNIVPMPREWFDRAADDLEAAVIRLHGEGVLSEGQASKMTGLDRVEVRKLADDTPAQPDTGDVAALRAEAELEADMERDLTESDQDAIERSLRVILAFDAVGNLRSVLSETMKRQASGYDWNADPDRMTLRQSAGIGQADRVLSGLAALSKPNAPGREG